MRLLVAAAVLIVVVAACGDSATPSPSASSTATDVPATAVPMPSPTPQTAPRPDASIAVRWVDAELPTFTGVEAERPFATEARGNDLWRLYVVRDSGRPQFIAETRRYLSHIEWVPDGRSLLLPFFSGTPSTGPARSSERFHGYIRYSTDGRADWETTLAPGFLARPSPDRSRLLITRRSALGSLTVIYLTHPDGTTRQLEGLPNGGEALSWSPDASAVVVSLSLPTPRRLDEPPKPPMFAYYLVPLHDGWAPLIPGPPSWSPDGRRLAMNEKDDLVLVDTATGARNVVSTGITRWQGLQWSADGRYIATTGGVIDAETATLVFPPHVTGETIGTVVLPGGRWLVSTTQPRCGSRQPPDFRLANQTLLTDLITGQTNVLLDCDKGFFPYIQPLPNGRLLMTGTSCWQCDTARYRIALVNVPSGELLSLNDFNNPGGAVLAPDGDRLLVAGQRLRIYTTEGRLLRDDIVAPAGFAVVAAAWSPDGRTIAYVMGPAGFSLL